MLVDTPETFESFMRWLRGQQTIALDTETTGLNYYRGDKIVGISIGTGERSYYLTFRHGEGVNLPESLLEPLIDEISTKHLLMWNANFDLHMLGQEGLDISSVSFEDAMLGAQLVNEQQESFALKNQADFHNIGIGSKDEDELREEVIKRVGRKGPKAWKGFMWTLPASLVSPYACTDVDLTWGLREFYQPFLDSLGFLQSTTPEDPHGLYYSVNDYCRIVALMERRGLLLDTELMSKYRTKAQTRMEELEAEFHKLVGRDDIQLSSHFQLRKAFGWKSSAEEFLSELKTPEAELILEWRAYQKAAGSYYDAYTVRMDSQGILRPQFDMAGTETGRLSCRNPNLQAVPRYNERQPIKDVFIARPGYTFMEFDLSQAELRVMAYFAGCRRMLEIFEEGRDLHTETATNLNVPRSMAKQMNLSSVYGIGAKKFAAKYDLEEAVAMDWLSRYHREYPEVKQYYKKMMSHAERHKYIQLPTGRIRHYEKPERNFYSSTGYNYGEQRASSNFIQGMVGELVRIAMQRIHQDFAGEDVHMLLTVHDSLLLEVPADSDLTNIYNRVYHHMTDFGDMPLKADGKVGDRWGKMREMEELLVSAP